MSELVVDLADAESVALARQVLELVSNDWPNPTTSGASVGRNTGEAGGSVSASADRTGAPSSLSPTGDERSSQIDSKPAEHDPWATDAASPETPRAATSAPSEATPGGGASAAADDDDDDPWS